MPVSVCFVVALQKKSKNEVAQKIPEKLQKFLFIGRPLQLEDEVRGRPTCPRAPLGAARGPRSHRVPGSCGHRLRLPFGPIYAPRRKNPRYQSTFSRSVPDLLRHRNLASGVTRILLRHLAGEGLGPRGHLHQLFFTPWCFLSSSSLDYEFLAVSMWYSLPQDLQYKVLMSCPTWLRSIWCNWCCVCWDPMNCYLVQS